VFIAFGPLASWEALGRFDASTTTFSLQLGVEGSCGSQGRRPFAPSSAVVEGGRALRPGQGGHLPRVISSGVMEGLAVLWWMRVIARSCRG
jgi:hypothetical protein